MSDNQASPLAKVFLWAVSMVAAFGIAGAITHKKPEQVVNDASVAAIVAAVVGYKGRKAALKP